MATNHLWRVRLAFLIVGTSSGIAAAVVLPVTKPSIDSLLLAARR